MGITIRKNIWYILVISAAVLFGVMFLAVYIENREFLAQHDPHEDVRFLTGSDNYAYTTFYDPVAEVTLTDADSGEGEYDRYDIGENADVMAEGSESDGVMRVYLPTERVRVSFRHLGSVRIAGQTYRSGDILEGIVSGETVDVSFLDIRGDVLEECPVRFYTATGTAAFYVEIRDGSLSDIAADKSISREILYEVVDAGGTVDSKGSGSIHGRGNQSWLYTEKQPYSINLHDAVSILGMRSASKWALLSTPEDYTMMMNKLVLDTCKRIEVPYAVDSEYVNLYIDGEYKGVYLLAQRVKNTDGAVRIHDLSDATVLSDQEPEQQIRTDGVLEEKYYDAVSPVDISGGYLLEFETDSRYAAADQGFTTAHRYVTVHSPDYMSGDEADYISSYVREAEDAVYNGYGVNPQTGKTWFEYLDAASWIKEFWIQEFYINYDADYSSTYFTKEQGDPLLYAGPCWDFDSCFWHTYYNGDYQSSMLTIRGRKAASWLLQLDAKEDFHLALTEYYLTSFRNVVEEVRDQEIPAIVTQIGSSLVMMYDRLGYDNKDQTYVDGIEEMFDTWINARLAFMDEFLVEPETYAVLYFQIPENSTHNVVIAIRKGEPVELTERIFRHKAWTYGDGQIFHNGDAFYEDTILTPSDDGEDETEGAYSSTD